MLKFYSILSYRLRNQGVLNTLNWAFNHIHRFAAGYPYRPSCQVTPELLVGGQYFRRGWKRMQSWGVSGVVNLREEFDDLKAGIAPECYLHLPTPDDGAPSLEQLERGVRFMREVINSGGKVYVHCGAGVGRAATMAAAYLVACGDSPAGAWDAIRKVRPFIKPTDVQVAQIEAFAALRNGKG